MWPREGNGKYGFSFLLVFYYFYYSMYSEEQGRKGEWMDVLGWMDWSRSERDRVIWHETRDIGTRLAINWVDRFIRALLAVISTTIQFSSEASCLE